MNGYNYNSNSNFAVGTPLDDYGQPDFTKPQVVLPQQQSQQQVAETKTSLPVAIAAPPPVLPSGRPVPVLNRGKNQAIALKIEIEVEINFKVRYDQ